MLSRSSRLVRREMQKCGKTREIGRADHNAAAAFTAEAAHAALKHSFRALGSHEQPTLCLLFRRAAKQTGVFHHQAGVFHHGHARRLKQFPRFGRDNARLHPENFGPPRQGQHLARVLRAILRRAKDVNNIHGLGQGGQVRILLPLSSPPTLAPTPWSGPQRRGSPAMW